MEREMEKKESKSETEKKGKQKENNGKEKQKCKEKRANKKVRKKKKSSLSYKSNKREKKKKEVHASQAYRGIHRLLKEFGDVFPKDVPHGLPPLRGIEHHKDLSLGATLPNMTTYKTNPKETKEI
ncbi:hypothetical protein CR513_28168, partial [Mucuna pruriens]